VSAHDEVLDGAARVVGRCDLVADLSWEIPLAVVLHLRTAAGRNVVAKRHADQNLFDGELLAYERWVPSIAERAPELVGFDRDARVLVITMLDGSSPDPTASSVQLEAGSILRRFHDAEPHPVAQDWFEQRMSRARSWAAEADPGVIDPDDLEWALAQIQPFVGLEVPMVPCHGDWQPRNWLVDASGCIRVIDFERAKPSWWIHDLQRLVWQEWAATPALAPAFLEGYGRALAPHEIDGLWASSAAGHIVQIAWATHHGDARFADDGRRHLAEMRSPGGRERFRARLASG
jgi:Ser/Thr protein kinase RdoA (MazF antagonist)